LRSEYALPPAGRSLAAAAVWPDAGATLNCQIPFAVLFIVLVLSFTKAANALVSKISMSCNRHHPHDRHRDRHRYRAGKLFTETARPAQPELRVRQPHRCGCSASLLAVYRRRHRRRSGLQACRAWVIPLALLLLG
jgi:hypothetical protein